MKNFSTSARLFSRDFSINVKGELFDLSRPVVMGILNATPDSFYEGSRLPDAGSAVEKAHTMLEQGARILDLGAISTRPGAADVTEEEEIRRLDPLLGALRKNLPDAIISLDTWRSGVVRSMHEHYHIDIVNDISAGALDPHLLETVARLGLPYILMHMQGTPRDMQQNPVYKNVVDDLLRFFGERIGLLKKAGLNDIIIDPGFGFGKTLEQNYCLLSHLDDFRILELPLLAGLSRKSMLYKAIECTASEALNATTAANMAALMKGASILRVHDVKAAAEAIGIFEHIVNNDRPRP